MKLGWDSADFGSIEQERERAAVYFGIHRIGDITLALIVHVVHEDEVVEGFLVGFVEAIDLHVVLACEHLLREDVGLRVDAFAGRQVTNDDFRSDPKDDADHQLFSNELVVLGTEV